jgi:hypothetical protein
MAAERCALSGGQAKRLVEGIFSEFHNPHRGNLLILRRCAASRYNAQYAGTEGCVSAKFMTTEVSEGGFSSEGRVLRTRYHGVDIQQKLEADSLWL